MKYRIFKYEGPLSEYGGPSGVDCWSDQGSVDADDARAAIKEAADGRAGTYAAIDSDAFQMHETKATVEVE